MLQFFPQKNLISANNKDYYYGNFFHAFVTCQEFDTYSRHTIFNHPWSVCIFCDISYESGKDRLLIITFETLIKVPH